jgi:hypothetical protein
MERQARELLRLRRRVISLLRRCRTVLKYKQDRGIWAVYRKRRKEAHPERVLAWKAVSKAKKSGRLVPGPCERCGSTVGIQAHHHDYSKRLEVAWLCSGCHNSEHHP